MKIINTVLGLTTIIFACAVFSTTAQAQSLYRCGSAYQDRPCDGAQKGGKLVGGTSGSPSANGSVSDAACVQRGTDAQKIVWAREGGAILEQQLAKASSANERQLVNDVYARRGTSSDIRAAIEADCITTKERAAQAAALIEASKGGQSPAASSTPGIASGKPMDAEQKAEAAIIMANSAREAANRKIRCDYMKNLLEAILSKQRAGGSAKSMDDLNQQKQEMEHRMSADKCG